MITIFRVLIFCFLFIIFTGCGVKQAVSEYVGGKDNTIPPTPLTSFIETADLDKVWSQDIGKGTDDLFTKITPTYSDEQIYIADHKGYVSALSADTGKFIWRNDSRLPITGGPGADSSLVLVGTSEGEVLGISKDTGDEVWRTKVSSEILSSPRESAGIVITRTIDGKIFALDTATGKHLWIYDRGVPSLSLRGTSTPVISEDIVIAGFDGGRVTVLELKTGKLVWETKVALSTGKNELERMVDIDVQPLVEGNNIYVSTFQKNVSALSLDTGKILWQREISSHSELSADEKYLYLTDEVGIVWSLNRFTGSSVWKQEKLTHRRVTGPANLGDKVIVCDFEGYIHWLDKKTGEFTARTRMGNDPILAQPINSNELLFIYSSSGDIAAYAYQNNEIKYKTKELDSKKSVSVKQTADKKSLSKNSKSSCDAYERSRKKTKDECIDKKETIEDSENVIEEKKSFFGRILNIFSDDSEDEEVE